MLSTSCCTHTLHAHACMVKRHLHGYTLIMTHGDDHCTAECISAVGFVVRNENISMSRDVSCQIHVSEAR